MKAPVDAVPVELGIRPEHVVLAPDAADAHEVSVEMTEPMGSDLLAWTRLGDLPLSIRLPAETKLTPGDRLRYPVARASAEACSMPRMVRGSDACGHTHQEGAMPVADILSIQLYTLRSLNDLDTILDSVAAAGFRNVEGIGSHLDDAANVKAKLDARGLRFSSSHVSLAALAGTARISVMAACRLLGFDQLFMPAVPPEQRDMDASGWRALGRELGALATALRRWRDTTRLSQSQLGAEAEGRRDDRA